MSTLAAYQDAFADALVADDPLAGAPPELARLVAQPGFAVYRNTVLKGYIDALQANYPTVVQLVGEEWFRAAAAVHCRRHLPAQPSLLVYGEHFPDFLAVFEPARELPYLADVARVDRLWTEAHVAADEAVVDPKQIAALAPEQMERLALRIHAATRWRWCDESPIYTLWRRNRDDEGAASIEWRGEGVLVTRPVGAVHVAPLVRGGAALLDACGRGAGIAAAVSAALDADSETDIAAVIRQLLEAGAFAELVPAQLQEDLP